jgi:hypothetical protein
MTDVSERLKVAATPATERACDLAEICGMNGFCAGCYEDGNHCLSCRSHEEAPR